MANAVQLADEFGNPITAANPLPTEGGAGGGGDASLAEQEAQTTLLGGLALEGGGNLDTIAANQDEQATLLEGLALEGGGNLDTIAAETALAAGRIGATNSALNIDPDTTDNLNAFTKGLLDRLIALLTIHQGWDADTNPSSVSTRAFQALSTNAATAGTRPANQTPYSANDAVSNHGTAGSVVAFVFTVSEANDLPVSLEEMMIRSTDTGPGTAAAIFRCFFYQTDPTASTGVVGGDNAAFSTKQGTFLGIMEGTFRPFSDGSCARLIPVAIPSIGSAGTAGNVTPTRIITKPGTGAATVFMLMQTLTIFTSSANSTVFTPTVEGFQFRA